MEKIHTLKNLSLFQICCIFKALHNSGQSIGWLIDSLPENLYYSESDKNILCKYKLDKSKKPSLPKDVKQVLQFDYNELEALNFLLADFSCFLQGIELAQQLNGEHAAIDAIKQTLKIDTIRSCRRSVNRELNRFKLNPVYK